ncbi:MAG TPA: T9SS type A sorting domain-containing protein [Bacteroidia bacterium]|jgi:hypothetical protein|nr:T9SS type A sorting domain-containing protein [Bacteroidia bacterium]
MKTTLPVNLVIFRRLIFSSLCLCVVSSASALNWAYDTYFGNGTTATSFTGLGFTPDLMIIKGNGATPAYIRVSSEPANESKELDVGGAYANDAILNFVSTGFTLGTNAGVNANGSTYNFVAFQAGSDLAVGTYTGNGGFSYTVSGLGFTPAFVIVYSNSSLDVPVYTTTQMSPSSALFGNSQIWTNYISSLNSGGFSTGTYLNVTGQVYYYAAFRSVAGVITTGSYTGSASSQNITTPGMTPEYVIANNGSVLGFPMPVQKLATLSGSASVRFNPSAILTTDITSLNAGSFTVMGSSTDANSTSNTNYYVAFGAGSAFPLPIQLVSFRADYQNGSAILSWETQTETNNDFFSIDRTYDGIHYETAGTVKGAGNSSVHRYYTFLDPAPLEGEIVYYRLKQTDFNGDHSEPGFTSLKSCSGSSADLQPSVYPNPATESLHFSFSYNSDAFVDLEVFDRLGKKVYCSHLPVSKGHNDIRMDLSDMASGMYVLRLRDEAKEVSQKFIKAL